MEEGNDPVPKMQMQRQGRVAYCDLAARVKCPSDIALDQARLSDSLHKSLENMLSHHTLDDRKLHTPLGAGGYVLITDKVCVLCFS